MGVAPVVNHKEYYKGEGGGFPPIPCRGESCESVYAHGSSMHQKCSNYVITSLLFGLCKSIWIINLLVTHLSPYPRTLAHPFYPRGVANKGTYPNSFFCCFHFETHIWIFQGIWGCINFNVQSRWTNRVLKIEMFPC